ncbi:unnamed protein product [Rhizophagus irregularis]|nr:unnamed protein product [Rhizophagus irregularis]
MVNARTSYKTYRMTSLPRRLYYKTKRVIMKPVRKAKGHRNAHTTGTTATGPTNTRKHPKLFGGFKRGRTKQTQPAHNTKTHRFFGYTLRKDPNRNYNNNNNNNNRNNHASTSLILFI